MRKLRAVVGGVIAGALILGLGGQALAAEPSGNVAPLSSYWGRNIQQWSAEISLAAGRYGIDPDLIAAVVLVESGGVPQAVSFMGAVGLMGIMPAGPGFEFRPTAEQLTNPATNINWGTAILTDILQQSGGDIIAALAAYNGGWGYATRSLPRNYAAQTLDYYARAVAVRSGISPNLAPEWTIAIEIPWGNIPSEPLILGRPVARLVTYGQHVIFDHVDAGGRAYYVRAYAVPIWPASAPKPIVQGTGN